MSGGPRSRHRRVFTNARVLTMDDPGAAATAVVIDDGRIVAVGGRELLDLHPDAVREDLGGRILCPGFIDAHNHLSIAALHPLWADLRSVSSVEGLAVALVEQAERSPETPWIRGAGWTDLDNGWRPHRRDLDALGLDRPVVIAHYSLHQCVVDSRALGVLGIGRETRDPAGGEIGRDPDGQPDGLLVERAWSQAHARSLAPYDDPDRWGEHIEVRIRELLTDGITAVHDAACSPGAELAYGRLAADGRLGLSVLAMPHPAALLQPPDDGRLSGPPTGEGGEMFRIGALKAFADGGVTPAIDVSLGGERIRYGDLFDGLDAQVATALEHGFDIAIHAIGNAGLDAALDAFERAGGRAGQRRGRVEHACLAGVDQLRRMADLGVDAVVQPGFLHHLGGQVLGVEFDDAAWLPFADMANAGITLAASSDDPCTFHEPVRTSAHGCTRMTSAGSPLDPAQALGYHEWLRAYTAGAAEVGGQTNERGRIAAGLRADLVVLDGELDPTSPPRVAQTWVEGRLVWEAPADG
jgi:predicted amidohydrolase YtcJ